MAENNVSTPTSSVGDAGVSPMLRRNQQRTSFTMEDVAQALEAFQVLKIAQNSEVHITEVHGVNDLGMLEVTMTYAAK